ncbi:uncharacterized protein EI90DRAFT_3029879 [Cantharellus anzutake]|uniref:uncharacterized protein n=1 Tax=Cantharellus anzutake TaxID=1750568 RepID=UPI001903527B|nr:uncharacterized protein EI90DRAFT_3029879 [Cantharellus anzutake]KAF8342686.1 hypothetical protein EI90DRAFT_3029879 [Cantharellus anzutake]
MGQGTLPQTYAGCFGADARSGPFSGGTLMAPFSPPPIAWYLALPRFQPSPFLVSHLLPDTPPFGTFFTSSLYISSVLYFVFHVSLLPTWLLWSLPLTFVCFLFPLCMYEHGSGSRVARMLPIPPGPLWPFPATNA